ncbi:YebB family permuted papain-like enzyme [Pseudomonas gingeri]|uniref:YebB family permuted papain-like enzyme n=1 Tax=Pseudomonas gingeri TaxID=117681 RepID=UPI0015A0A2F8|nr:YebB family permuted papain-like enzyme [Pseudomonas gingeri]NWD67315.1 YebB family permuted papain-like enzyme [Pseudomonas gingeri]
MSINSGMNSVIRSQGAHKNSRVALPVAGPTVGDVQVGDLVFIRVTARPFLEVSNATNSWTNHVGVVVDNRDDDPLIAESTFPFARTTPMTRFLERSEHGRCAVARLTTQLDDRHRSLLAAAADRRMGTFYDTGFNISSRRQFCSRFVREVIQEATDIQLGEVETFATLLQENPDPKLAFWRVWYFGRIPWQRRTVTPASVLRSPHLRVIFDV